MTKLYPLLLVLASCGTQIKYLGSSHPATQEVDVFVTQSSIKNLLKLLVRDM